MYGGQGRLPSLRRWHLSGDMRCGCDLGTMGFRWREPKCKGPEKGVFRENQEAKVLGGVGEEEREGGQKGLSGGREKLREISRQYPQKGNLWRQKAGCLGLGERGRWGSDG